MVDPKSTTENTFAEHDPPPTAVLAVRELKTSMAGTSPAITLC